MDSFQFQQLAKPKQLAWIGGHTHSIPRPSGRGRRCDRRPNVLGAFEA